MISTLMVITSMAMFAFPKQLRGNRIPAPHEQIDSIDTHKSTTKAEQQQSEMQQPDDDAPPQLKGMKFLSSCLFSLFRSSYPGYYHVFFLISIQIFRRRLKSI